MNTNIATRWVWILGAGLWLAGAGGCQSQDLPLDPLPRSIAAELSLRTGEHPSTYKLITNTNLLDQAGLSRNPDYLTRRADLEDVIRMDGVASFLALYGTGGAVRLMVKGVYFRALPPAVKYAEVQSTRQRPVSAYRLDTPGGLWLLFIACDHDQVYDDAEMVIILQGLERYQRRLKLTPVFDQISNDE